MEEDAFSTETNPLGDRRWRELSRVRFPPRVSRRKEKKDDERLQLMQDVESN